MSSTNLTAEDCGRLCHYHRQRPNASIRLHIHTGVNRLRILPPSPGEKTPTDLGTHCAYPLTTNAAEPRT